MRWPYPSPPNLGLDLPSNREEGEEIFDKRVKARFPTGTPEAELIKELRSQGFQLDREGGRCKSATKMRGLIVKTLWSVRWRAHEEHVSDIWGVFGYRAP